MANSELPPILCHTYQATLKGFAKFTHEANAAHLAGYDLVTMTPLGTE
jgi:hypothetical protein